MKTLLILRHAKSSWNNSRLTDHERPLNARGRRDAPRMGRLLRDESLVPDLIVTSSAERAFATAELVALACDYEEDIVVTRDLYHGVPEDYVEALYELGGEKRVILVVGHNPGIEELVTYLTGEEERMPTAALAQVTLPIDGWRDLGDDTDGVLEKLWLPKTLG